MAAGRSGSLLMHWVCLATTGPVLKLKHLLPPSGAARLLGKRGTPSHPLWASAHGQLCAQVGLADASPATSQGKGPARGVGVGCGDV